MACVPPARRRFRCAADRAGAGAADLGGKDQAAYRATLGRIRDLAAADAQVWYGHDPRQFATLRTSIEGWYE